MGRYCSVAFLLLAPVFGAEPPRIEWAPDWDTAFKQAKESGRPVMVCINSRDGETANETTAGTIYKDPLFIAATRKFVMLVVSTANHATDGVCPRFGGVTCKQHVDCWRALNEKFGAQFVVPGSDREMISPQHAWFTPDGRLIRRKEYQLGKQELMRMMRAALTEAGPITPGKADGPPAALSDSDRAELARLTSAPDKETRAAALGNLLATGRNVVLNAIVDLLGTTKNTALKGEVVRALASLQLAEARPAAEKLLLDADPSVRSSAAVALEELGDKESIPLLVKRVRAEDDPVARKNVCRALGVCGGASGDKGAAKALLDAATGDKQKMVCKHAALALRWFAGDGAAVVRKKLEQAAGAAKDPEVRRAMVYALAFVGDAKTTVPVLEKILNDEHEDWGRGFVRGAISRVQKAGEMEKGEEDPFAEAGKWLFSEDRDDPARG